MKGEEVGENPYGKERVHLTFVMGRNERECQWGVIEVRRFGMTTRPRPHFTVEFAGVNHFDDEVEALRSEYEVTEEVFA